MYLFIVRIKAKEIIEFIQDDDKLREERKKAKKNKDKYVGINSEFSTRSSSYSDFRHNNTSSSSSHNSGGFGSDLHDKGWRSNNPSLQDRITDITSKVKNILETNDEKEPNVSGDDDDEHNTNNNKDNFADEPNKNDFNFNKVSACFYIF